MQSERGTEYPYGSICFLLSKNWTFHIIYMVDIYHNIYHYISIYIIIIYIINIPYHNIYNDIMSFSMAFYPYHSRQNYLWSSAQWCRWCNLRTYREPCAWVERRNWSSLGIRTQRWEFMCNTLYISVTMYTWMLYTAYIYNIHVYTYIYIMYIYIYIYIYIMYIYIYMILYIYREFWKSRCY